MKMTNTLSCKSVMECVVIKKPEILGAARAGEEEICEGRVEQPDESLRGYPRATLKIEDLGEIRQE